MSVKKTLQSHVSTRWGIAAMAVAVVIAGAVAVLQLPAIGGDDKSPLAVSATSPSRLQRIAQILKDEGRDTKARIQEALRILESDKTANAQPQPVPQPAPRVAPDTLSPNVEPDQWDPFAEMRQMRQEMDRAFSNALWHMGPAQGMTPDQGLWSPQGQFQEKKDGYVYRFDVPGVEKGKLNVTLEDGQLILEGSRESRIEKSDKDKGLVRTEVRQGRFQRVLALPSDADTHGAVETHLKDGVLTVEIPKRTDVVGNGPRRLDIQ